ncbi:MAG: hypothetical protein Q8K86_09035 [Candidatus Nanopelagicaceae bacterium]|nr:hypothetical protein [Candidatus Nanopelagicaceae bacterium]
MKKAEKTLLEAISGLLSGSMLGIEELHGDPEEREHSHRQQFMWSHIEEAFRNKIVDSPFHDSIKSAFHVVHSYKYLDDPRFMPALLAEMRSRAVPKEEMDKAVEAVKSVTKEVLKDGTERDFGWNEKLDEIVTMIQDVDRKVEKTEPFTGGVV